MIDGGEVAHTTQPKSVGEAVFAKSKKVAAFTLAEVLVTLGIIGIVAAMTMPTVIENSRSKQLEAQNKKAQAVLANGFKMLEAKEEVNELTYTSFMQCESDADCIATNLRKVFNIIEDSVDGKPVALPEEYDFAGVKHDIWTEGMSDKDISYIFVTNDGVVYGIEEFQANSSAITVYTDVNGNKRPNKGGEDLCKYVISSKTGLLSANCAVMATIDNSSSEDETSCGMDIPDHCMVYDLSGCHECEDGYSISSDGCSCDLVP